MRTVTYCTENEETPDRILPTPEYAKELQGRTLTHLYNESPQWLRKAHEQLDAAVAAAYGWHDYSATTTDDEVLSRLLALNADRARGKARAA